jgi:hypothetical protein
MWLYDGPMPGKGMPHMVTSVDEKEDQITTWSAFDKDPNNGGFSWLGDRDTFLKMFRPLEAIPS